MSTIDHWQKMFSAVFEGSAHHVAMLDMTGAILAVNAAWRRYGVENGLSTRYESIGKNYLSICEQAAEQGDRYAMQVLVGLMEVLQTGRAKFILNYPCHSPGIDQWYRVWIERQLPDLPVVIVAHANIGPAATQQSQPGSGVFGPRSGDGGIHAQGG